MLEKHLSPGVVPPPPGGKWLILCLGAEGGFVKMPRLVRDQARNQNSEFGQHGQAAFTVLNALHCMQR
jgi:hypothetical protein